MSANVRGRDLDGPQDLHLLVAQRVRLERRRRLHRDQADELEEVVLEDVARRAGLLVERAAVLDPDRLGHRDLHVVDVAPVPERLEDPVAEPEDQQVADGLLAEVVVDAVDLRLAEDLADLAIEPLRGIQVVPERLLDDDPPPAAVVMLVIEADPSELADDLGELDRLGGEIEQAVAAGPVLLVELVEVGREGVEGLGIGEIEVLVEDPLGERVPGVLVEREDPAVLLERLADLAPERLVVVRPPADRHEQELVRQQVVPPQLVERRHDLAMGEVAGRPEQHEDRRIGDALEAKPLAQDVLDGFRPRRALALAREADLAHRQRRVLGPGRRLGGDGLVGGRLFARGRLDRAPCPGFGRLGRGLPPWSSSSSAGASPPSAATRS